jgi:hypothetical protein
MMGDWISFLSGVALMVSGCRVMWAYRPRGDWRQTAAGILGFAIFLGFFGAVFNTVYWQVWGQITVEYLRVWSVQMLRFWGDYTDVIAKGSGAVAAELHLWALRKKDREK